MFQLLKNNSQQQAKHELANVKISNPPIDEVDSTKLLGGNVDKTLSLKYLPSKTRIKLYVYYVKLLIEYCSLVWGVCSKGPQTNSRESSKIIIRSTSSIAIQTNVSIAKLVTLS